MSASAYTVEPDGVDKVYTWDIDDNWSFNTYSSNFPNAEYIQTESSNRFQVNAIGSTKRFYGGANMSGTLVNHYNFYSEYDLPYRINIYYDYYRYYVVADASRSCLFNFISSDDEFSSTKSLNFNFDITSIGYSTRDPSEYLTSHLKLNLTYNNVVQYSLTPSLVSYQNYTSFGDSNMYFMSVNFGLDIESGESVIFNGFTLEFNCVLPESDSLSNVGTQYNRISLGMSKLKCTEFADKTVSDYYDALTASNNQMINYYNTINSVDQAKIDSQKNAFSGMQAETSKLNQVSSLDDTLKSQFDVSDQPIILGDSDFLGTVESYWDLLPLEDEFFATAFGMIGSIALLSLILHAGARGVHISTSRSSGDSSRSSDSRSNSKNKSSNRSKGG